MKIALAQINPIIGDLDGNTRLVAEAYHRAVALGADLVLTPELIICGYPPRDLVLKSGFVSRNLDCLETLAAQTGDVPLVAGHLDFNRKRPGKAFANAASVLQHGRVLGKSRKSLLPTYDVFDEARYFQPAEAIEPIIVNGRRIGITVCEDIWTDDFLPDDLYTLEPPAHLGDQGIDLLLNLSASPYHMGKPAVRRAMVQEVAKRLRVPIAYCNAVGGNDQLIFDGFSFAVSAKGELLAQAAGFVEDLLMVDFAEAKPITAPPMEKCEELWSALVLGLRDYMGKCGFKTAILGLSGGIDSALTAAIAAEAIGAENVYGVSMPSGYSSEHSKDDAKDLAERLGVNYESVPIEGMFQSVKSGLAHVFAGKAEDITEENMQARLRGLTLMSISNKCGHLLLTTGNKSELAVGYCTIYGDMCGGLAVISDLPKMDVFALSRWINREREIIPWNTIDKPPSAELRPDQKDQDTLPPYETLDAILALLVEQSLSVRETAAAGYDLELVRWIQRRIDLNEWKRHQAAPGLRVTTKAFGQGRRIPIAQRYREQ